MPPKSIKIGEIGQVVGGGTPPTSITEYYGGNIPWLSPKDLSTHKGRYIKRGERNLSELGLFNSGAKLMPAGTVLLSSRAPIGYLAIAANDICTNQGFKSIIPDKKLVNSEFLYYYLKCHIEEIKDLGSGTTFAEISGKVLENYEVFLPELDIQRQIANILSQLDDKIELNQIINDNLYKQAKSIFKKYQQKATISCIIADLATNIVCGKTPPTSDDKNYGGLIPFITIPDMHGQPLIAKTERYLSDIGARTQLKKELPRHAVCVSCIATPGLVSLALTPSHTNQQINSIICKKDISPFYVFFLLSSLSETIIALGTGGSTTLNLNKEEFSKINVTVIDKELMRNIQAELMPFFNEIEYNLRENEMLMCLRNYLLPKLMSGEIDVSSLADSQLNNHLL